MVGDGSDAQFEGYAGRGAAARRDTVRFYEREGLLRATRTRGGHRAFSPAELDRLNFIVALREAGWSLEEIAELLAVRGTAASDRDACLPARPHPGHAARRARAQARRAHAAAQRSRGHTQGARGVPRVHPGVPDRAWCRDCRRLPAPAGLPRGFRLTWRSDG